MIPVSVIVSPTGPITPIAGLPAGTSAVAINAAIKAISALGGGIVQLVGGTYTLTTPILMASNVILRGVGDATVLVPTFTGAVDDPTNAVIKILGVLDTPTMNTTLAAIAPSGARSLTVATAGAMAAGSWFVVRGHNATPEFGESEGDNIIPEEMFQASAVIVNALSIYGQSLIYHDANHGGTNTKTAVAAIPVVRATVSDLRIRSLDSTKDIACAIYARYATECSILNVSAQGCTRRMIECIGVKGFRFSGIRCLGNNNGIWMLESCCDCQVDGTSCWHGADVRVNAHGKPKFSCWLRVKCTNVQVSKTFIRNMALGGCQWGGYACQWNGGVASNLYPVAAYDALCADSEHQAPGPLGIGWNSGAGPIPWSEFGFGNSVTDWVVHTVYDDTYNDNRMVFFLIHDNYDIQLTALQAYQLGLSGEGFTGIRLGDSGGRISGLNVRGVAVGFHTWGDGFQGSVSDVVLDGRGASTVFNCNILFDHAMSSRPLELRFRDVHFHGSELATVRFGASFGGTDWSTNVHFENLYIGAYDTWCDYARLVQNNTATVFSAGDVCDIDNTNSTNTVIRIITPTGVTRNAAVVMTGQTQDPGNNAYMLAAIGPQRRVSIRVDAAAGIGDLWEATVARRAHPNNGSGTPAGRVMQKITVAGFAECTMSSLGG